MKSTAAVTTIAIDLSKNVFQLALSGASFRIARSFRLKRADFLSFWSNQPVVHVVMEACGSAHHFGRWLRAMGHRVTLLPPIVRSNRATRWMPCGNGRSHSPIDAASTKPPSA